MIPGKGKRALTEVEDVLNSQAAELHRLRTIIQEDTKELCDVCNGEPLPHDKPCICEGFGTSAHEKVGLRMEVANLAKELSEREVDLNDIRRNSDKLREEKLTQEESLITVRGMKDAALRENQRLLDYWNKHENEGDGPCPMCIVEKKNKMLLKALRYLAGRANQCRKILQESGGHWGMLDTSEADEAIKEGEM